MTLRQVLLGVLYALAITAIGALTLVAALAIRQEINR